MHQNRPNDTRPYRKSITLKLDGNYVAFTVASLFTPCGGSGRDDFAICFSQAMVIGADVL